MFWKMKGPNLPEELPSGPNQVSELAEPLANKLAEHLADGPKRRRRASVENPRGYLSIILVVFEVANQR